MVSNRKRLATLFVLMTLAVATMALGTFASEHTDEEAESQATTYLRVAHLGPDAPAVDVYLDNETVVTNASFGDLTPYLAVHAGTYNVTITPAGDNTTVVHAENVTLEPRAALTVAASGELAGDENNSTFGLHVYTDDALHPGPNSSALRVVHLSPDAGAVTLTIDNGTTTLAENLTNGELMDYQTIAPGNYTVEIREADGTSNGTILATANVSVNGSEAVTAWAVGYTDPMNDQQPFTVATTADAVASIALPGEATATPNATSTPTETETVPTGTATETETAPTETETGTATEPTETGTETESEPTETGTATEPTETETGTATEPTGTETANETPTVPPVTTP